MYPLPKINHVHGYFRVIDTSSIFSTPYFQNRQLPWVITCYLLQTSIKESSQTRTNSLLSSKFFPTGVEPYWQGMEEHLRLECVASRLKFQGFCWPEKSWAPIYHKHCHNIHTISDCTKRKPYLFQTQCLQPFASMNIENKDRVLSITYEVGVITAWKKKKPQKHWTSYMLNLFFIFSKMVAPISYILLVFLLESKNSGHLQNAITAFRKQNMNICKTSDNIQIQWVL